MDEVGAEDQVEGHQRINIGAEALRLGADPILIREALTIRCQEIEVEGRRARFLGSCAHRTTNQY